MKVVFAEMQRQGVTYDDLEWKSGVLKSTFKAWRTNNRPGLDTMEAALGALGWAFLPVPSLSQLPPSIQAQLKALAAEWGDLNPILTGLLAHVCGVRVDTDGAKERLRLSHREAQLRLIADELGATAGEVGSAIETGESAADFLRRMLGENGLEVINSLTGDACALREVA